MNNKENLLKDLNVYLANLNVLNIKLHNYHWNVKGPGFFQLHEQFEALYNQAFSELDEVAERILALGSHPASSMKEYLELATLKERASEAINSLDSINEVKKDFQVMKDHALSLIEASENAKDPVTADMFTGFAANYEKALWMLNAYLG